MNHIEKTLKQPFGYPCQFWLIFVGILINGFGTSMVLPFLFIFVKSRLELPLSSISILMTVNSIASILATFVSGPLTDELGRKWLLVISLLGNGLSYLFLDRAYSLLLFSAIMALIGFFNPIYQVGSDAMLADLIPKDRRMKAYAIMRVSQNVGFALGPAVGSLIAIRSYSLTFSVVACSMLFYGVLLALFARETLSKPALLHLPLRYNQVRGLQRFSYWPVLKDKHLLAVATTYLVTYLGISVYWILLPVYLKTHYGILETQYGILAAINAVMLVLFQVFVTRMTQKLAPLSVMAIASFVYAVGIGAVAYGQNYSYFVMTMVIITLGELIIVPPATTYIANLAPANLRGTYMSIYGLTGRLALGIGPVICGYFYDHFGRTSLWFSAAFFQLIGGMLFLSLSRKYPNRLIS